MRSRIAFAALVAVVAVGVAYTQAPKTPPAAPTSPKTNQALPALPDVPHAPAGTSLPSPVNMAPGVLPTPQENIDQMLDRLEQLRAQKAELEKKEQELLATIRKRIDKQTERLDRMGITLKSPEQIAPPPQPAKGH
jgi:hypothetical protein